MIISSNRLSSKIFSTSPVEPNALPEKTPPPQIPPQTQAERVKIVVGETETIRRRIRPVAECKNYSVLKRRSCRVDDWRVRDV
jgi:hypothetical protein